MSGGWEAREGTLGRRAGGARGRTGRTGKLEVVESANRRSELQHRRIRLPGVQDPLVKVDLDVVRLLNPRNERLPVKVLEASEAVGLAFLEAEGETESGETRKEEGGGGRTRQCRCRGSAGGRQQHLDGASRRSNRRVLARRGRSASEASVPL